MLHGGFVIGLYSRIGDVQVNLGSAQVGMPEQALDGGDRHPGLGEVAAKGVAKLVTGEPQPGLAAVVSQSVLDAGDSQALSETVEKDRFRFGIGTDVQPDLLSCQRLRRKVDHALFAAFAVQPQARQAALGRFQV